MHLGSKWYKLHSTTATFKKLLLENCQFVVRLDLTTQRIWRQICEMVSLTVGSICSTSLLDLWVLSRLGSPFEKKSATRWLWWSGVECCVKADLPLDSEIWNKINANYAVKCLIILHSDQIVLGMDTKHIVYFVMGMRFYPCQDFLLDASWVFFLFLKLRRCYFWVHLGSKSYMI